LPSDRGYAEIKYFQDKMRDEGIPLSFLRKQKNGRFVNLKVKVNKVAGDGDKVRELQVNAAMMANLSLYSPQAQEDLKRRDIAIKTQDYDFAEQIVPREQEIDGGQVNVANNENQSSLHRGITEYVPSLNRDDIHMIHIPEHLGGLQALLAKGQISGWDRIDMMGFASMFKHTGLHLEQIRNNPASKALATQIMQTMQGFSRQAQEFANNLQAKEEAEQQGIPPNELARLQLDGAKLEQKKDEQRDLVQHRADSLDLSREKAGIGAQLQLNQQNITASQSEVKNLASIGKQQADQSFRELEFEQKAVEKAREETISGDRESQGRVPQKT